MNPKEIQEIKDRAAKLHGYTDLERALTITEVEPLDAIITTIIELASKSEVKVPSKADRFYKSDEEIEQYVMAWMSSHEPDTFVKNENGVAMYSAGHSSINLTLFFEDLLRDFIDGINENDKAVSQAHDRGMLPTTSKWAQIEQKFYDWKNECENRDNSESWTPSNYELFNFIKNEIVWP